MADLVTDAASEPAIHVYFDPHRPHLHVHLLLDDDEAKRIGFGLVELVCHACHASLVLVVSADPPLGGRSGQLARTCFEAMHARCVSVTDPFRCPPTRHDIRLVDLRLAP